jgi:GDP-mannose 6-dehydrogenase
MRRLETAEWHADGASLCVVDGALAEKPAISIIGLGYVGAVSIACLSNLGFRVVGVDIAEDRVRAIKAGRAPIVEDRLEELLTAGVDAGLVDATADLVGAVEETDVTFLAVGTPTAPDGSCDLTYVRQASRAIGQALKCKDAFHVVVLRCSVPPGTTLGVVAKEVAAASGKVLGEGFGICFNPEFLREGVAVADYYAPPKTVIGASDARTEAIVSRIHSEIDPNILSVSIQAAEMVKYADNVWHAAKVAFGNEIGRLCHALDIDSHEVMNVFVKDTKLNLSPYYLRPGFAFGGSCLPKEVRAVGHLADELGVDLPLVQSVIPSNDAHIAKAHAMLAPYAGKRIGFLGLAFKPDTDDLRESPTLELMSRLRRDGFDVAAFDGNIKTGAALASQIAYVRHACPGQAALMDELETLCVGSAEDLIATSDVLVVSHATDAFRTAVLARPKHVRVLDLVRLFKEVPAERSYQGIAW